MKLINEYFKWDYELNRNPKSKTAKAKLNKVREEFYEEIKNILRVEKLDEFSIEGFINTHQDKLFYIVDRLGGIENLKNKTQIDPKLIAKPENLNNYETLIKDLINAIDLSQSGKKQTIVFVSDFDGDGAFAQNGIEEFSKILKEIGVDIEIINIEERNDKGRGVNVSELEHKELENVQNVDLFITTDSNFVKQGLEKYVLPKKYENTKFIVTDHHHTQNQSPSFIDSSNYYEVNPHLSEDEDQEPFSGAAVISLVLREVLERKSKEGLFFNTEVVDLDYIDYFNSILFTTNTGDVAVNNPLLEYTGERLQKAQEHYNLFNQLNLYKRLGVEDFKSFEKQMPEEMSKEKVQQLWDELKLDLRKITIFSKNQYLSEAELLYEMRRNDNEEFKIEDYRRFLLNANDSYIKRKVGGRHDLMKTILADFKKTHQKIQRAILAEVEDNSITTSPETSNLNIKEYSPTRGYKIISTAFPPITETAVGMVRVLDKNKKLDSVNIVGGRSSLSVDDKSGWELFQDDVNEELVEAFKSSGIKLNKTNEKEIKDMIKYLGHGGAFGGYITIPKMIKASNLSNDKIMSIIKEAIHKGITKTKQENKEKTQENKIYITEDNLIEIPSIIKMNSILQGDKQSSLLPNIVIKLLNSYTPDVEKVYESMGLFSSESLILRGNLKPGDYVEYNVSSKGMMMSHLLSESEVAEIKKYNQGNPVDSPHVFDLENEIKNATKLKEGVYVSKEKVEVTKEPKISIDLETTGSNSKESEIYNVGIVSNDGEGNLTKYSIFVKTHMPLSSIVLTRISQEFLDKHGSKDLEGVDETIVEILKKEAKINSKNGKKPVISAHNGMNFDFRMLVEKLSKTYNELMNTNLYQLVDTTFLARAAMSEETGLEIKGTKIKTQNYSHLEELNVKNWILEVSKTKLQHGTNEVNGPKLYNLFAQEEFFRVDMGTDKVKRLNYYSSNGKVVLIEPFNEETANEFVQTRFKEVPLNAKFSIDLITKLVATHDIMYKLYQDKLQTTHPVDEKILDVLGNRTNTKNAVRNHLTNYYFTLSPKKNVTLLLNKLNNLKADEKAQNNALKLNIESFMENINLNSKYGKALVEILENDEEAVSNIEELRHCDAFEDYDEKEVSKDDLEQFIYETSLSLTGFDIDANILHEEYMENTTITQSTFDDVGDDEFLKYIDAKLVKKGYEYLEMYFSSNEEMTIKQLLDLIKEEKIATRKDYSYKKAIQTLETEIGKEILDIQKKFLQKTENQDPIIAKKARITEEISTVLYLVSQDYLINIKYEDITKEQLEKYSEDLSKKTNIPKELILKVTGFIKNIYENKEEEEFKVIYEEIEHYFKKEHHQAMEDAKAEQEVMKLFLQKFYPIVNAKETESIKSASSEMIKRKFAKTVRDDYEKRNLNRLPAKYNNADQDVFVNRKDGQELNKNDYVLLQEYIELRSFENMKGTKIFTGGFVEKEIEEFKKVVDESLITPELMDIFYTEYSKKSSLDKKSKNIEEKMAQYLRDNGVKENEVERISLFFKSLPKLNDNCENIDFQSVKDRYKQIEKDYNIVIGNREYQIGKRLRGVVDQKEGYDILSLPTSNIGEAITIDKNGEVIKNTENKARKREIDLNTENGKSIIELKIEGVLQEVITEPNFTSKDYKNPNDNEKYLIDAIEDFLYSLIDTMELANRLNIDNLEQIFTKLVKDLKKPLPKNDEITKFKTSAPINSVKEYVYKYNKYLKEVKPGKKEEQEEVQEQQEEQEQTSSKGKTP